MPQVPGRAGASAHRTRLQIQGQRLVCKRLRGQERIQFFQRRHPRAGNPSDGRHPGSRANIHPGACRCHHHFHFHFHFHDQLAFLEPCQDGVPHLSFLRHGKAQPSIAARTDLPLRR